MLQSGTGRSIDRFMYFTGEWSFPVQTHGHVYISLSTSDGQRRSGKGQGQGCGRRSSSSSSKGMDRKMEETFLLAEL